MRPQPTRDDWLWLGRKAAAVLTFGAGAVTLVLLDEPRIAVMFLMFAFLLKPDRRSPMDRES